MIQRSSKIQKNFNRNVSSCITLVMDQIPSNTSLSVLDLEIVNQLVIFNTATQVIAYFSILGIGQKFAILEIKSLVSKVLRYFEISLDEDSRQYPTLTAELILAAENKINFYLKPRVH